MTGEVRFRFVDGQVEGLWFDEFEPLYRDLGIQEVGRASNVEWSERYQQWEVRLSKTCPLIRTGIDRALIGRFDRRDEAIAFEVDYIQRRMGEQG
jgi:hypothetical protein